MKKVLPLAALCIVLSAAIFIGCAPEGESAERESVEREIAASRAAASPAPGSTQNVLNFHVYKNFTQEIDPFADELGLVPPFHNHAFYGNKDISQNVSGARLLENRLGSNSGPSWATEVIWRPVVTDASGNELSNNRVKNYYRLGIGTPENITHLPYNAKILGTDEFFSCGQRPDRETPPLDCNSDENFKFKVLMPQCYDPGKGNVPQAYTYPQDGACPAGNRIIPELTVNFITSHKGPVNGPLKVSAGDGQFMDYTFLHADLWGTYQRDAFKSFMEECVFKSEDAPAPAKCKPDGNEEL